MTKAVRPNLIIIYPDQLRADAMGCAGNSVIKTPHFDRLAREGVQFNNAFVAFPLCAPFRASLYTGKYPHTNGMYANHYAIHLDQDFLPEILRGQGYQTGYFGKWHLDGGMKHSFVPPGKRRLGFERFVGFNRGHEYFNSIYYRDTPQPITSHRYEPDFQTDHLIEFMSDCLLAGRERPFLAVISYGPPHPPLVAPEYFLELYTHEEVPVAENTPQCSEARREAREFLAKYYGLIANIDHNVGRILDWLDWTGLNENTVVILLSDHGEMAGEHGRYAKKTYYRSAMQVPYLVRFPGRFPAGHRVDELIDPSVDSMPTLLDLLEIPWPQGIQGISFLSLLEGGREPVRDHVYYEILKELEGEENFPVPERGLRTLDWLYVRTEDAPLSLYDVRHDPLEMNNLVHFKEHQRELSALDHRLAAEMERLDDRWEKEAVFLPENFQTHSEGARYARQLLRQAIVEP
jgi:arylsulfatase A-like enzyme